MPNSTMLDPWGIAKGTDNYKSSVNTVNKAYGLDNLDRNLGRLSTGLSKTEQAKLQAQSIEDAGIKAANEAVSLFQNNAEYKNASVQKRGEMINDYIKNKLPTFMQGQAAYQTNPNLAASVSNAVNTALTKMHSDDLRKINDESFWSFLSNVWDSGMEQQNLRSTLNAAATEDTLKYQEAELQNQAELIKQDYEAQLAELKANAQAVAEDPVLSENYRQQAEKLQNKYQQSLASIRSARKNNENNAKLVQKEQAKAILDAYEKYQTGETDRLENDPLYRETLLRQGELSEEAKARDEAIWLGLRNNDYKTATIAKFLVENMPDLLGTAAVAVATAPGGTPAQSTAIAAYNLATVFGQVGQQVLGDIMEADLATLEKSDDYRAIRDDLLKQGSDAQEADSMARIQLAVKALQDQNGLKYAPAVLTGLLGPVASVLKNGLPARLLSQGILKRNVFTRAATGAAFEAGVEGGEEVYENALAIDLANKTLNTDRSLFEDWQQNFGMGALLGGVIGAPGLVFSTAGRAAQAKAAEQAQTDAEGTAGSTTRSTLSGETAPTPDENISVEATATTHAYSPERETTRQQEIANAQQTLGSIANSWVGQNISYETVNDIPVNELQQVASALQTVANSGKRGDKLVDTWIRSVNTATGMDLTYNAIQTRNAELLAQQEQQATQPSSVQTPTTEGVTNGTINGRNQGTTATDSQTADTQQTETPTAQSTDTEVVNGDSSAAQSTGTSGTTRQDARTSAQAVQPNQSENGQTGQGTYSGRDNTGNDTTGSQSDLGTGSTVGTTEQRTVDGGRSETDGSAEQTRTDVDPAEGVDTTVVDSSIETIANRDFRALRGLLNRGESHYAKLYNHTRAQIYKVLKLDPQIPSTVADYYTVIYMRMASTISQLVHMSVDTALPIERIRFDPTLESSGKTYYEENADAPTVLIGPSGLDNPTLPHEFIHVFIGRVCELGQFIKNGAANGDASCAEFVDQFTTFAHVLGMDENLDPFNIESWGRDPQNPATGSREEAAAIAFEIYFSKGQFPEKFQRNIEGLDTESQGSLNRFLRSMAETYRKTIDSIVQTLQSFKYFWNRLTNGSTVFPDASNVTMENVTSIAEQSEYVAEAKNQKDREKRISEFVTLTVDYSIPRMRLGYNMVGLDNSIDVSKITVLFDNMLAGYKSIDFDREIIQTADDFAYIDTAANEITIDRIRDGMAPDRAYSEANDIIKRAMDLAKGSPDIATGLRTAAEHATVDNAVDNDADLEVLSTAEDANNPVVTDALTSDQDLIDISTGLNNPDVNSGEDVTNPMSGLGDMVGHNDPQVDGIVSPTNDAINVVESINGIASAIEDGLSDSYVDPTTQDWFADFNDGTMFNNEDGTPKLFYHVGHVLTTEPTGADMETQTYARSVNTVSSIKDIMKLELDADTRKSVIAAYNEFSKSVKAGKPIELNINIMEDMIDAGIYAFDVDGTLYIMDSYDISDMYQAQQIGVRGLYNMNIPLTENEALTSAADVVRQNSERFSRAAQRATQNETLTESPMQTAAMSAPQKAGRWQKWCTTAREFINSDAAFHTWDALNFAQLVGEVSSSLFRSWTMTKPKIQGADIELSEKIMNPIDAWIKTVAKQRGEDFDIVKQELGRIRTDFHILEAARKEEEDLRFEVTRASMIVDGEVNPETGAYETAEQIQTRAQEELDNYLAFQRGDIDPRTNEPIRRRVYGGRRVKDITAELFDVNNGLVTKYGENLVQQALGRFGKAFADATQFAIERGAISQEDVASFGEWAYYTPLTTKPEYENGDSSDVVSMYPKRIIRHRGGSFEPAVDGYTALQMLLKRTANAVGSVELSRDTMGAYQRLRTLAQSKDPNVDAHTVNLMPETEGPNSPAPLKITYYNGMAVTPYSSLMAHVEQNNEFARELDRNKSLIIRVLEPVYDAEGNRVSTQNRAYAVLFDNDHADVGKAFGAPFKYDKEAADRYKTMRKITSGFASLFTTYKPFFPPINAIRDFIERTYFSARKVFRDVNGEAVYGEEVALRMQANMTYAPEVMKAVFTGKPEQIGGKIGDYLSEFKRQGIMTSASIRAMLQDMGNTNYAYIEKAIEDVEKGGSVTEALDKLRRAGRGTFRLWAEMYYAIPTFAMYKSLRDSGVSEADAAFHVTEMMNLSARGKFHNGNGVTGLVGALFPFVTSIGQTATQLANYFGLNVTTFGHSKSKENAALAAKSWGYFAGSVAMSSAAIAAVATMLGDGDDEEGYRILDDMSLGSFTFLPVPVGDGQYFKFPLGFGPLVFAFQTAMGISRVERGVDTGAHVAMNLADSFYRNISPLGGPDFEVKSAEDMGKKMLMTCTPLLAQPLVQLAVDRNYFGATIQRDRYLKENQRRADIDSRRTPEIWKTLAKGMADSVGLDMSPESVRHLVTGYMAGPLTGIVAAMENDALTKDPMYASTRDILGPIYTAIGAGSMFSTVGNRSTSRYWNELNFYNNLIKDAGVADLITVKKGEKVSAYDKQYNTLLALGFGEDVARDYADIHQMEKDLAKIDKEFKSQLDLAYKANKSQDVIEEMYRGYAVRRNNFITSKLSQTNYYQGLVRRGTVQIPPRELINAYRERNQ